MKITVLFFEIVSVKRPESVHKKAVQTTPGQPRCPRQPDADQTVQEVIGIRHCTADGKHARDTEFPRIQIDDRQQSQGAAIVRSLQERRKEPQCGDQRNQREV
jgi:hypothetical protein